MLYVTYIANNLGTVRKSKDVIGSQNRDILLYAANYMNSNSEYEGNFSGGEVLHDWIFNDENPHRYVATIMKDEITVLVAYLSTIGRNSSEISKVIDSLNGNIIVAELPDATSEELKIYAKLEDSKKKFIGLRSKAGIKKNKLDGTKFGGLRNKTDKRNQESKKEADKRAAELSAILKYCISQELSLQKSANLLNEKGFKTAQGKNFKSMTVKRYIDRLTD